MATIYWKGTSTDPTVRLSWASDTSGTVLADTNAEWKGGDLSAHDVIVGEFGNGALTANAMIIPAPTATNGTRAKSFKSLTIIQKSNAHANYLSSIPVQFNGAGITLTLGVGGLIIKKASCLQASAATIIKFTGTPVNSDKSYITFDSTIDTDLNTSADGMFKESHRNNFTFTFEPGISSNTYLTLHDGVYPNLIFNTLDDALYFSPTYVASTTNSYGSVDALALNINCPVYPLTRNENDTSKKFKFNGTLTTNIDTSADASISSHRNKMAMDWGVSTVTFVPNSSTWYLPVNGDSSSSTSSNLFNVKYHNLIIGASSNASHYVSIRDNLILECYNLEIKNSARLYGSEYTNQHSVEIHCISTPNVLGDWNFVQIAEGIYRSRSSPLRIPVSSGGTGLENIPINSIIYGNEHAALGTLPIGNNGQVLSVNNSGALIWSSTAGGTSRTVAVDTSGNGSADATLGASETLTLKKGTNVTLSELDGVVTINSTDTNTVYTHPNHSGHVTSNADGATTIANDVITEDMLVNSLLAEIDANTAKATNVSTNLSITGSTEARTIISSDGTNAIIPVATTSASGVMSTTIFDAVTANTAKVTNTDVDVSVANLTARLPQITENVTIGDATNVTVTMAGNLTVTGNLLVSGDTVTVNTATLDVEDLNITVGKAATTSSAANGAGLTFGAWSSGTTPTFIWSNSNTRLEVNKSLYSSGGFVGALTGNVTGNVSGSSGSTTGNAATATKLATARAINGVNFDGSAPITVTADATTLTGTSLKSTVVGSSLTSVGTLTGLQINGNLTVGVDNTGHDVKFFGATAGAYMLYDESADQLLIHGPNDALLQLNDGNNAGSHMSVAGGRAKFGYTSDSLVLSSSSDKGMIFAVNNGTFGSGEVARFDVNGKFGIGVTNPYANLTVNNNLLVSSAGDTADPKVEGILHRITSTNNDNPDMEIFFVENHGLGYGFRMGYDGANNRMGFFTHANSTSGSEVMRFDRAAAGDIWLGPSANKVMIGTTDAPAATLHVDAPATTAPSLTFGAAAGQIFQNENSELAIGLDNAPPYSLWIQGRTSTNAARNIGLQGLGGNVGIGTDAPTHTLQVNGSFTATTKEFTIPHPSKKGMTLSHGSLEGPEFGVYVRGKSKDRKVYLPDYWKDLVHEDSITVQLTSIGKSAKLYVVAYNTEYIEVENDVEYFYYVQAERKDVDKLEVEF